METARAKVNLWLHVLRRRPDGRHDLDSAVVFAEAGDTVAARPARGLRLAVAGPFAPALAGAGEGNLALRAARALAAAVGGGRGAAVALEKRLPVAAGLGGGSADAAAVLRALARLWRVSPPPARLRALAAALGADVPACLAGAAARLVGAGDAPRRLAPPPRPLPLVLVNPGAALPTAAVFAALRPPFRAPEPMPPLALGGGPARIARALARRHNDLEAPARHLAPAVGDALAALAATPRCLLARMSGSGATCFGLYPTMAHAEYAAAALRRRTGGQWWICATRTAAGAPHGLTSRGGRAGSR